ncbi:hypothetical protein MJD09_26975, partial [bacterium]|nr:hypothetical protein [bacterium]
IQLEWSTSTDGETCSGLAGYRILRNGKQVATTSPNTLSFEDILPANTPSGQFTYQIHPFDSVGNVQTAGAVGTCDYVGTSSISLQPLEKFTQGLSREICGQVTGTLLSLNLYLDENCDSVADDSVLITSPSNQLCYIFDQLEDGREYCYWGIGLDEQQRVVRSDTVRSIQDDSVPVVDLVVFPEADTLNGELWLYDNEVQVRFQAHDAPPGEVWYYEILENGQSSSDLTALPNAGNQVDEIIVYAWATPINQLAKKELSIRVVDGAGNASEFRSLNVNVQQALPKMFAFPNPFNPVQAPITIRLYDPSETEVSIYDFFGNLVKRLTKKANSRDFVWDGRNGKGEMVASGGYVCVGKKTRSRFKLGVMKQEF